ncbi:hypothetical protein OSB04_003313 [Centaurea solstitialis]|uniref:Uncharacterized protein n=1 Tax=Centaurea solstitialis TaxID=347529 RepID=A0AA38WN37_9ASTR|nr:hypothetical protein OSB04_003313 [Centaurea solstitialis]
MSSCSSSGSSYFLDDEELLQFEARCKELRIEKDMLKESSFELIRSLESHARTLSESRSNDKKRIQDLERELSNCSQEIDYLQDQLNGRDTEINHMTDYIHTLETKLREKEGIDEIVTSLGQELTACNLERLALLEKLDNKEQELHDSTLSIENLEESISNVALEYQCDIESMKLDLMAIEHSFFEAKELQEEVAQEHHRMQELTKNYKVQIQDTQNVTLLVEENKILREKLKTFESNAISFLQEMSSQFPELLKNQATLSSLSKVENDAKMYSDILSALLVELVAQRKSDADSDNKMKKLSSQIHEYELLVNQLKEQLRDEKLKAKEEAEDLAQEMAELRYQLTGLLEEEYKKRACIEHRALQRITELEAQIGKEQRKTFAAVRGLPNA